MVFEVLKELLFPRKCVFCGGILSRNGSGICHTCRTGLPEYQDERYLPKLDGCCVLWYYEEKVRESLLRFKFFNRPDYAQVYGPILAMKIRLRFPDAELITWVPVSGKRLKERGYDQSELLAQAAAKELDIPAVRLLEKHRNNPAQSGIEDAGARKDNVRDAYRVCGDAAGKRMVLVDDILTTGATAGECARMLRNAGAAKVYLAAAASGRGSKETEQPCTGKSGQVSTY